MALPPGPAPFFVTVADRRVPGAVIGVAGAAFLLYALTTLFQGRPMMPDGEIPTALMALCLGPVLLACGGFLFLFGRQGIDVGADGRITVWRQSAGGAVPKPLGPGEAVAITGMKRQRRTGQGKAGEQRTRIDYPVYLSARAGGHLLCLHTASTPEEQRLAASAWGKACGLPVGRLDAGG